MDLVPEARQAIAPIFAALGRVGVTFDTQVGEGGNFIWKIKRRAGEHRELRAHVQLLNEHSSLGEQAGAPILGVQTDASLALELTFYGVKPRREIGTVELKRQLRKGPWSLSYVGAAWSRMPEDMQRFMRRIGLEGVESCSLRSGKEVRIARKLGKEFYEQVMIPREARQEARK
jgi:hypothetical protein